MAHCGRLDRVRETISDVPESGIKPRGNTLNVSRTQGKLGGALYACAPERACAVFLLARIRHWNRDRGCEPDQLAVL